MTTAATKRQCPRCKEWCAHYFCGRCEWVLPGHPDFVDLIAEPVSDTPAAEDTRGLSVDMLDVDFLRRLSLSTWLDARNAERLVKMANALEATIHDIGSLREDAAKLRALQAEGGSR